MKDSDNKKFIVTDDFRVVLDHIFDSMDDKELGKYVHKLYRSHKRKSKRKKEDFNKTVLYSDLEVLFEHVMKRLGQDSIEYAKVIELQKNLDLEIMEKKKT